MCLGKALALAKEENICLNQLVYSMAAAPRRLSALKRQNRGNIFRKRWLGFFLWLRLQFSFAKISQGGAGGREVRKEIKTHSLPCKRAPEKNEIKKIKKSPFLMLQNSSRLPGVAFLQPVLQP